MTRVEFTLKSLGEFNNINIPKEARCLFPDDKVKFTIKSDTGEDTVKVMAHKPKFRPHIHLTTMEWFKKHYRDLKDDQQLIIEITKPKSVREYHLKIVK
jgi:hypothetical protein